MENKYNKGSEWRKWDLHIHTPGTAKNDEYGIDHWEDYITKLESLNDIFVLGITDYYSIDNYIKIKDYQKSGRLPNKYLIPNIELRILPVTAINTPINLHILFDPEIDISIIEREFLRKIKFTHQGSDYSCIKDDLISLGKAYKSDNTLPDKVAWKNGIEQFNISFTDIKKNWEGIF